MWSVTSLVIIERKGREALAAGVAPPVSLWATHRAALDLVDLAELKRHALDLS